MNTHRKHTDPSRVTAINDTPAKDAGGSNDATLPGLDPIRGAKIRDRIMAGAYDSLSVVDMVARKLLEAGDV